MDRWRVFVLLSCAALAGAACSRSQPTERVLYANSLDTLDSVLSKTGTSVDAAVSRDGRGSIRVDAVEPTTVRLAEVATPDAESAILIYRAHLRSQDLAGQAYLEMWCNVPGKGEFFSRALHAPLSGTSEWVSQQTPFFLEKGQRADGVRLNLVVQGKGTVWIDDLSLAIAQR